MYFLFWVDGLLEVVIPTENIKDIMDSTRKSYFFEFHLNWSLVSEIIASKSLDKKLAVLVCNFFVEHAENTA